MNLPSSLKEELEELENLEPFTLIFYGSRARGEADVFSDYNFYLLASSTDIMRADFRRQVTNLMNAHFPNHVANIVFNDFDSFQFRMSIHEPTASHIMEMGEVVFGNNKFQDLHSQWEVFKKEPIQAEPLLDYVHKRIKFLNKLKATKTLTENIARIEAIIVLRLQTLIISNVADLSLSEIISFDIPTRFPKLILALYKNELPQSILSVVPVCEQVHEAKRIAQVFEKGVLEDKTLVINSIKKVLMNSEEILERLFLDIYKED